MSVSESLFSSLQYSPRLQEEGKKSQFTRAQHYSFILEVERKQLRWSEKVSCTEGKDNQVS